MRSYWALNLPAALLMATLGALSQPALLDYVQADDAYSRLSARLALNPEDLYSHYEIGLLLAASEPNAALAHLDFVAAADSPQAAAAQDLARVIRAARLAGDPSFSLASVGQALARLGEWQLAANALERAVEFAPHYADAWAYLGEARQQLGGGGLAELEAALAVDPDSLAANLFTGLYWQRQADFKQAQGYIEQAQRLAPDDPAIFIQLGWNTVHLGDVPGALEHFLAARDAAPGDPESWKALARYCADNEIYVDQIGLAAAYRAVSLAADDPEARVLLGRMFFLQGKTERARQHYTRALELDASHAPAHLYLGLAYLVDAEWELAMEQLEAVLALAPESREAGFASRLIDQYGP